MSTTKKYYWFKMKTDFFENISIKLLRKQKKGDELVILFLKVILYSLKTDGYLYYKKMMPSFHEELALAIDEKPNIIKELVTYLINFDALETVDENTYFIKLLEDCVGSESKYAVLKREERKTVNVGQCPTNDRKCPPEIEIEKEIDIESEKKREDKNTSAFSPERKSGSINANKNFSEKTTSAPQHNSTASKNPPRNYEMEELLRKMGKDPMSFYEEGFTFG